MGVISGTGVFLGLLATLTLYPALLALWPGAPEGDADERPRRFGIRLPTFPDRHPRAVCAVAAVVTVFAGVPFNFANIIVLPLILGIGVDSGIHLVHRRRIGLAGDESLLRTSTANAVLFSALTTAGSFVTLALSNHLGISSLALLLTVGVALMLAANLIVLPAILALVDP